MELDPVGAATVLHALDALEAGDGVPRVDGAERRRLAALAAGVAPAGGGGWSPRRVEGWYLGLRPRAGGRGVVAEAGRLDGDPVAVPLATADAAGATRVWLRGAAAADVAAAGAAGWSPRRELLILGRALGATTPVAAPVAPAGLRLAPLSDVGPAAVARLLTAAYASPRREGLVEADADAGAGDWTVDRFGDVAAVALADPSDLLLAVAGDGRLVGAHWTGRRPGDVGEVFNLAVDPDRTGEGIGAWLLAAGLAHLERTGHRAVVLWVDRANAPARTLYARAGFTERGRDVALEPEGA